MTATSPTLDPVVLPRGHVFGQGTGDLSLGELRVMERRYAPRSRLPPHRHAQPNLCLVVSGGFEESTQQGVRRCGPATLLYRPSTEIHAQAFHADGAVCVTLEPSDEWWRAVYAGDEEGADLTGEPTIVALRLYVALRLPVPSNAGYPAALAETLGAVTARRLALGRRAMPAWLREVRRRLHAVSGPVRLGRLAACVGVHRAHLARAFRRAYGCSAREYLRWLRVELACRAILGGERSLSRIAADVGFSDHSHFTRVFRSTLGLTPRAFRDVAAP